MVQTIRFAAETDATQIMNIYALIVANTAISFQEVPPSRPEMAGRIRSTLERYPCTSGPNPSVRVSAACAALMASTV
jgi:L-amino acid N-acyltransferase YncA